MTYADNSKNNRVHFRIMSTKIFVAGLPSDVRESELRDIFSKVGFGEGVVMGSMEAFRT